MKQRKKDVLYQQAVIVQIVISNNQDHLDPIINERLPEGFFCSGRIFQFPAGYRESYRINNKDYNFDGDRSLNEQRELVKKDLLDEGFTDHEIDEFMEEIEIERGNIPRYLSLEDSKECLKDYPHFETEALHMLSQIKSEIHNEQKREFIRK